MNVTPLTDSTRGTVALGDDIRVRRLGYGAMRLGPPDVMGPPPDRPAALAVLRRAVNLGVNLIDTSDAYGPHHNEELIAEALHPYPDGLVVATKGGLTRGDDASWTPDGRPEHLREACQGSLKRLQVDTIDLYQLHRPDPNVAFEDSVGTLSDLRDEGKIRLVGLSNVDTDQLTVARAVTTIASVQNQYNLHDRDSEPVLRACEAAGIAFMPYFPLKGFGYSRGTGALTEVGQAHLTSAAAAAIAWLMARSPVMVPIPGTSSITHLEENVRAAGLVLRQPELDRLDAFNPAASGALGKLARPLPQGARDRIREASGPLRRLWSRLSFWD